MAKISVNKLLDKKDSTITKAETDLIDDFTGIENKIYNAVNRLALKMNQSEGKILFDDENTQAVNEINEVVRKAIQSSEYPTKVREYLRNFETIKEFNFDIHQDVNDLNPDELNDLINPVQRGIVEQTLTNLTGAGINTNFSDPLREGIFKNIVAGTTISDLQIYLQSYINTNEERMGQLKKYVSQVSRDALNQFDGQVNSRIAEEFGLNAFRYVGSLIDDSRPQCIRWVGKEVLLYDELPNEISWAYSNGTGMIPGTTRDNFAVYRGGYNCRHSAIPFKLTKSQKQDLIDDGVLPSDVDPIPTEKPKLTPEQKTVQPLSQAQKDLNLTFGESPLTPKALKGLNVPDQVFILSNNGKTNVTDTGSYYTPDTKETTIGLNSQRAQKSSVYGPRVIVHEFGHRTHIENGFFLTNQKDNNPKHQKAFDESVDLFVKKYPKYQWDKGTNQIQFWASSVANKYRGKIEGFTDKDIEEFAVQYTDTIQAITKNKLGEGHPKKYFTDSGGSA
ncbi:MAG: hypothetical protein ACKOPP_03375, partial [Bacteroidota bacterium]